MQATERASARVEERLHQTRAALGGRVDLARELHRRRVVGAHGVCRRPATARRRAGRCVRAPSWSRPGRAGRRGGAAVRADARRQRPPGPGRPASAWPTGSSTASTPSSAAVRTAAGGVHVRLGWEVDAEQLDAVKSARALLLRDPADLTDAETAVAAGVRAGAGRSGSCRARGQRTVGGAAAGDARLPVVAPVHAAARPPGLGRVPARHGPAPPAAVHGRAVDRPAPADVGLDRRPLRRRRRRSRRGARG